MTDHDKPTPEREAEIQQLLSMPLEHFVALGVRGCAALGEAASELKAALDAERAAHRETRDSLRRTRGEADGAWASSAALAGERDSAIAERDEALAEVERLRRALDKAKRWPVL